MLQTIMQNAINALFIETEEYSRYILSALADLCIVEYHRFFRQALHQICLYNIFITCREGIVKIAGNLLYKFVKYFDKKFQSAVGLCLHVTAGNFTLAQEPNLLMNLISFVPQLDTIRERNNTEKRCIVVNASVLRGTG
ncbi:MAG: hypothetical protein C4541_07645 [Candidatus Auribacter fodinae]|jgi:hypothetical protein|uniref:Uncharacterized protein n=1 Tax=Candidatus Auribacter fodinae TaxID=2093366 RepID=A0A3A4R7A6_9BACT|nr:MAG: hypothetical protein C4541_07645 [Candidatus Auribacter fodinae]